MTATFLFEIIMPKDILSNFTMKMWQDKTHYATE